MESCFSSEKYQGQVEVFGLDVGNLELKYFMQFSKFFPKNQVVFLCFVRGSDFTDALLFVRKSNHAFIHELFQGKKHNCLNFINLFSD